MKNSSLVNQEIRVGIADYKVAYSPDTLITLGLGSCVGIVIYDYKLKIGGMSHIMLPDSRQFNRVTNPLKFADLAIPQLLEKLISMGGGKSRFRAKIAGGAQMFSFADSTTLNIGERNIAKVKEVLKDMQIALTAAEVGGNIGRTMIFHSETGKVFIRSAGKTPRELREEPWTLANSRVR
ncbi:chemotaxis protein CheD [Metallumcola ferriviriculae]|uniref:Probable chemoreceptor glutamine deamidase CheD n=1 Tax=Metallumcola ferriviriculae TaxID=3039180 RepID=A0AAU0URI4_9FIRM|nr:chemotaxis protein CheD [Desulfitibacteraceae bacterium MK1]